MVVRDALPDEMDAAGALRVAAYQADRLLDANPSYAGALRALGTDGAGEVLVAVDGDRLLGTVMLETWHAGSEVAKRPDEAEIRGLAVAPEARGRGVGTALVRAVVERAALRGVRALLLSSQPAMAGAQRIYLAEGFTRRPELDWAPVPNLRLLGFGRDL
ncbi:N-acetyltransferase [Sphaerisporangium siamense]|uniref:Ribosomal protein S18 acetylase RimI-like enzyme n=1 Tax=Sphaerisporangium siamense TaxID=795645 RepID=A0A7W7DCA6_9ACTN|nr:GNAT family N-acetyltransferase [Sphaerisporangium siamense]MBB4704203.1 ribosomal protein S18 acetylase RimI-like enzyme [Sphaerisporangium siamense]GII85115.1 N-acetyltransferase [Sphaerisporangium siamense]